MNLGKYMHSVGYGAYGDDHGGGVASLLNTLTTAVGTVASAALEPMEISEPAELAGAKLTKGFKIVKAGRGYKIALAANIPGVSSSWVGVDLGDPSVEQNFPVAGGISVKYIPAPKSNLPILIGLGVVGVLVAGFILKPKKKKRRRRRR